MMGKTERTVKRNVLDVIEQIIGVENFRFSQGTGEAVIYGRKVDVVGANDVKAEGRIRGLTLAGAYVDEATLIPEPVYKMLLSRLSVKGAKLFATTNPDSPFHWLKLEYLDNPKVNKKVFSFTLDDNLSLDPEYVEALKSEYTGIWYDRFVLGKWVMAQGVIYSDFSLEENTFDTLPVEPDTFEIWVDFGTTNPTAALLVGVKGETFWVVKEFYHDPKSQGDLNLEQVHNRIVQLSNGYNVERVIIDAASKPFILEVRKHGLFTPIASDKDVLEGIHKVSLAIKDRRLMIHKSCINTLKEFSTYVWDDKASLRGEDKPLKQNDHCMDAIRYGIMTRPSAGVYVLDDGVTDDEYWDDEDDWD